MDVVDDEHDRPRRRNRGEPRPDRLEQAVLLRLGGCLGRAEAGDARKKLGNEPHQRLGVDTERAAQLVIALLAHEPAQSVDDRLERCSDLLVAPSVEDERTPLVRERRGLLAQSGLADAGLAEEPDGVRPFGGDRAVDDERELVLPPDELRRGRDDQLRRHRQRRRRLRRRPHHAAGGDRFGEALQVEEPDELELEAAAAAPERAHEIGAKDLLR